MCRAPSTTLLGSGWRAGLQGCGGPPDRHRLPEHDGWREPAGTDHVTAVPARAAAYTPSDRHPGRRHHLHHDLRRSRPRATSTWDPDSVVMATNIQTELNALHLLARATWRVTAASAQAFDIVFQNQMAFYNQAAITTTVGQCGRHWRWRFGHGDRFRRLRQPRQARRGHGDHVAAPRPAPTRRPPASTRAFSGRKKTPPSDRTRWMSISTATRCSG